MDLLVIIFGIFGWIYNSFPLLMATLILSSIGVPLSAAILTKKSELSDFIAVIIYLVGLIASLVRILQ